MTRRPQQTVVDQRLAEHRCVWCGYPLPDTTSDALFDTETCQTAWHTAGADYASGAPVDREANWAGRRTEPPPSWLGPQPGIDYEPDRTPIKADMAGINVLQTRPSAEALTHLHSIAARVFNVPQELVNEPAPVSNPPRGASAAARLFAGWLRRVRPGGPEAPQPITGPELPPGWDYAPPPGDTTGEAAESDGMTAYGLRDNRPDIPTTTIGPDVARPSTQGTALSYAPHIHGATAILQDTDPPPPPRTGWPLEHLQRHYYTDGYKAFTPNNGHPHEVRLFTERWHALANHPGAPLLPYRECPRCGNHALPVPITAWFPIVQEGGEFHGRIWSRQRMTKLCCQVCRMPYPGPTIVPIVRPPGQYATPDGGIYTQHHWEYGAVIGPGATYRMVTHLAHYVIDGRRVWHDLYEDVQDLTTPLCCIPRCGKKARRWLLLAGSLAWDGWYWTCADNEALRMGMCLADYHHLTQALTLYANRIGVYPPRGTGDRFSIG